MAGGVEYQVTKVDPTDPETKGMVYQVHKVTEEVAATLGGKVYRARIINDPTVPTVAGKVYQIVLIGDPDDPAVKGKVYNAILTGGSEAVVVGPAVSPLALDDAVADTMEYVKAYGGTEQDGTPTPTVPVDIVCNNGVLKARHQSGLPLGYTLVDGITANGTQYIDTGIKIASTDVVETEFENTSATGYGAVYGIYATGESSAFYANQTYYGYDEANNKVNTNIAVDNQWHTVIHDFVNGTLQLDNTTVTFTPFEFVNTTNNGLFARFYNGSYGYFFKGSVKSHKITRNGVVIFNAVSVQRDSDSALGMYDFVSGTFFENDGTGDFTAGDPVSDPVEIYTDGTVETIKDSLNNTATAEMLLKVGDYQDVQSILDGVVTRNVGVKVLDGTENWTAYTQAGKVSYRTTIGNASTTVDPLKPVISTHFVYKQYAWTRDVDSISFDNMANNILFIRCLDYGTTQNVTGFKQYLAEQYAAGTPVIIVYPLATETTESVTGQTLQVQDGDNTLEITQASIDGLELEAEYEKEAE